MNTPLIILVMLLALGIVIFVPGYGASAVLVCMILTVPIGFFVSRIDTDRNFLFKVFIMGLMLRVLLGAFIFTFKLQDFFGGDARTYDILGRELMSVWWEGNRIFIARIENFSAGGGWGMLYLVAAVYALVGRNQLAVQFVNAALGAATAPLIYLCARQMFQNLRVARIAALLVAFYPSLVLWSSQGLKDAPIVFLLSIVMYATLKLGEKMSVKFFLILIGALFGVLSLRFYIFYMLAVAIAGSFIFGMRQVTAQSFVRQFIILIGIGLALTYIGVLRTASADLERVTDLEAIQRSRLDLSQSATSGFGQDVDVSTTYGAFTAIPLGLVYLLLAPFPWHVASLRQIITLPEMILWWCSFPLLIVGLWFTLKHRFRQVLPVLMFTTMLSISYSIFQGNIGTAYRQRSQLLVFFFIFVAVGFVLLKEIRENKKSKQKG